MSITKMLEECEKDTQRFINYGAASHISSWRQCSDQQQRVVFIKNELRNERNKSTGFAIHLNGGTSLESIVLSYPELFTDEDYTIAASRLGFS